MAHLKGCEAALHWASTTDEDALTAEEETAVSGLVWEGLVMWLNPIYLYKYRKRTENERINDEG